MEKGERKKTEDIEKELKDFDFVQFTMCDVHGIPRGKLVPREVLSQACREGVGIYSGTLYMGVNCEVFPLEFTENFPSGVMRPLAGTAHPLAWSSAKDRRMGLVFCQLELKDGEPFLECPRLVAQRQVDRLALKGWRIKSAYEVEFDVLKRDTQQPLGVCNKVPYANMDIMDRNIDFVTEMLQVMRKSDIHLEYFYPEYQAGQFEVTMQPQWGVAGADDAFLFRYGVRSFCHRHGLQATFMALPFDHYHTAGLHFNHSLWTQDDRNVFRDPKDPMQLSETCRHWIAGLLEHAPALMALCSPTLNCYRRMGKGFAPGPIYWNLDDRLSTIRAKNTGGNVYLENRMPSSAGNPYLILAATIAAGMDGVDRRLACPAPGKREEEEGGGGGPGGCLRTLPASLEEALEALEKDEVMRRALGGSAADYYLAVKRELEMKHFQTLLLEKKEEQEGEDQTKKEREYYMEFL